MADGYPNHYQLKKNRILWLQQNGTVCKVCNKKQVAHIHHIDGSKDNHALDNLVGVCAKCHSIVHSVEYHEPLQSNLRRSKYRCLYGMTLNQIVTKYGGTSTTYIKMHQNGTLKTFLEHPNIDSQPYKNSNPVEWFSVLSGKAQTILRKTGCVSISRFMNMTPFAFEQTSGCGQKILGEIISLQNKMRSESLSQAV